MGNGNGLWKVWTPAGYVDFYYGARVYGGGGGAWVRNEARAVANAVELVGRGPARLEETGVVESVEEAA